MTTTTTTTMMMMMMMMMVKQKGAELDSKLKISDQLI